MVCIVVGKELVETTRDRMDVEKMDVIEIKSESMWEFSHYCIILLEWRTLWQVAEPEI